MSQILSKNHILVISCVTYLFAIFVTTKIFKFFLLIISTYLFSKVLLIQAKNLEISPNFTQKHGKKSKKFEQQSPTNLGLGSQVQKNSNHNSNNNPMFVIELIRYLIFKEDLFEEESINYGDYKGQISEQTKLMSESLIRYIILPTIHVCTDTYSVSLLCHEYVRKIIENLVQFILQLDLKESF